MTHDARSEGAWRAALRRVALASLVVLAFVPRHAEAETPRRVVINDPFAGALWRIDIDAAERHIVAGSADKAAISWPIDDIASPELMRVPPRDEEKQRAHAVAISPDGKRLAYAVPPTLDRKATAVIYIIERGSKRIETAIEGIRTRPQALRFSPDGAHLAATLSDGCGLRVWATSDWTLVGDEDANATGTCCPLAAQDCDPLPDTPGLVWTAAKSGEKLIATAGDTGVRVFQLDAKGLTLQVAKTPAEIALERPEGLAVSPEGTRLAVADARVRGASDTVKLQVAVLDLATLAPLRAPLTLPEAAVLSPALLDVKQTPAADQMSLNRVAWMEIDGEDLLFAAGVAWCQIVDPLLVQGVQESEAADNCIVRWRLPASDGAQPDVGFIRAGHDRVMDLAALPKRKALAYAGAQRVAAVNSDGTSYVNEADAEVFASARALDLRDRPVDRATLRFLGFDVSPDASTVYVEDYRGTAAAPVRLAFSVQQLKLESVDTRPANVAVPNRDAVIIDKLANWWNSPRPPVIYGKTLDQPQGQRDTYRSVALAPNKRAVVGSANAVRYVGYDGDTATVLCERRIAAEAYRVAVSEDGSLAVVGHADGTLRWYRLPRDAGSAGDTCMLEQLLVVHIRQSETEAGQWIWAAWEPHTNHFAADPRIKDLVGYLETFDGGRQVRPVQFSELLQLYSPDVVRNVLARASLGAARSSVPLVRGLEDARDGIRILALTPDEGAELDKDTVRFDLKVDGDTKWPRQLLLETGGGSRLAKAFGGKDLGPNDAIDVAAPGVVQLQVKLPASERQQHRNIDLCAVAGRQRTCQTVNWAGALAPPPPRALRAVLVGLSAYNDPAMQLDYAQNDALDLARLFVNDYRARVIDKTSKLPADYSNLSLDLVVAPTTAGAKQELAELAASGVVRVHEASIGNVVAILQGLAQQAGSDGDLMLFYFSGHGMLNPLHGAEGLTALLGPGMSSDLATASTGAGPDGNSVEIKTLTAEVLEREALTSDRLIALLSAIPGEKVVVIDACRNAVPVAGGRPFDPAAVRLEFERNLMQADFFFSAAPGQTSLDQGELAYSAARPEGERGNGLFTYAFLKALTDPGTAPASIGARHVEVYDVDRYIRSFFDGRDEASAAMRLVRLLAERGEKIALQQPMFVPARRRTGGGTVLRTLEPAP